MFLSYKYDFLFICNRVQILNPNKKIGIYKYIDIKYFTIIVFKL
ncbi:hypothetical protein NPD8_3896 (plasmid) [Clostridium botulinum]|uniref:Uncharacterized protein n=1 Tax=Clostridium botulinum TaxID=1491 RepID=A0A1L7JN71_CLOBO|nr:hypothetical protein NPD8_3896 [Clostridium botulinum]